MQQDTNQKSCSPQDAECRSLPRHMGSLPAPAHALSVYTLASMNVRTTQPLRQYLGTTTALHMLLEHYRSVLLNLQNTRNEAWFTTQTNTTA